jgi:hypothetical protein
MKKILLGILSIGVFVTFNAKAQETGLGVEMGFRGAAASSWLFNSNVSAAGNSQNYAAAFSYNYGVDFSFDISSRCAIEADVLLGTLTQGYSGTFQDNGLYYSEPQSSSPLGYSYINKESYTAKSQLNIVGIPVLFRFGSGNGAYFEIGPEYDIVNDANYSANFTGQSTFSPPSISYDTKQSYSPSNIQGVIGFGDDFQIGNSGVNIITNLRFSYGLTDIKGTDGLGQDMNPTYNGSQNQLYVSTPTQSAYYTSYKPTHSATASFSIGVYYFFGINGSQKNKPNGK